MRQPVSFTPWRSIRDGAVGVPERDSSFAEALDSPCSTCRATPCCTHLPLQTFRVANAADLSQVAYLLNFDRIRVGVKRSGDWSVYYVQPCQFLDRQHFRCTVHGTPEQPQICVQYNPYTCWYKPALTSMVTDDFLLIDRSRFAYIAERTRFDDLRNVVATPPWEELLEVFASLADPAAGSGDQALEPPIPDAPFEAWRDDVLGLAVPIAGATNGNGNANGRENGTGNGTAPPVHAVSAADGAGLAYEQLRDPCAGCGAPCCETLTFHQGLPTTISTLDFFRFALGFPGIELFVTDESWWLVAKTRCRHLRDGRCSVYGLPERPLFCKYYDAWKCTYRVEFGMPRPPGALRVRLEHFAALTDTVRFDPFGAITAIAPVDAMRPHVEEAWRQRSKGPGPTSIGATDAPATSDV